MDKQNIANDCKSFLRECLEERNETDDIFIGVSRGLKNLLDKEDISIENLSSNGCLYECKVDQTINGYNGLFIKIYDRKKREYIKSRHYNANKITIMSRTVPYK